MPYDASLRPETTYLPFNTINPGYGPIDIRVADNYTGNQPSQVFYVPPSFLRRLHCAQPLATWIVCWDSIKALAWLC